MSQQSGSRCILKKVGNTNRSRLKPAAGNRAHGRKDEGQTSSSCKYHTSNAAGIRCKTCEKMATGKSWMNCFSMTTVSIVYEVESQKSGIIYKWTTQHDTDANDKIHVCVTFYYTDDCVTLHDADVNDDMNDCVTPHDAHSTEHIH